MAQIVETISGDRRIQLANEEHIRQMGFGAKWNKIRITARISINGTSNTAACQFVLGVCAGLRDGMKSSNTTGIIGGVWPGNLSATQRSLNYNAGAPAYYQSSDSVGFSAISRVGSSNTYTTPQTGLCTIPATSATPMCVAVDISRVGTVYTLVSQFYANSSAAAQAGNSIKQMIIGMDSENGSPWSNMTAFTFSPQGTLTNANPFDCVVAYWSLSSPSLEISDLTVTKFS